MEHLDISQLGAHEVEQYRPGLKAMDDEAGRRGIKLRVRDVKDKRSGPVVYFDADGPDDGFDELFEAAMRAHRK